MSIDPAVAALVANALGIKASDVTELTSMDTCSAWASLAHIELISALEESYGVSIDEDTMFDLTSVKAIDEYLRSIGALRSDQAN